MKKFIITNDLKDYNTLIANGGKLMSKHKSGEITIYVISNTINDKFNFNNLKSKIVFTNKLMF